MNTLELVVPDWPAPQHVRAAFTLRTGGVSAPPLDSLNLGEYVGDRAEAVMENRRLVKAKLQLPAEPLWLRQVHGTAVVDIGPAGHAEGHPLGIGGRQPEADAAIARVHMPGSEALSRAVCAVQVADCLPVLLTAGDGSVIAAAHAGWRGLAAGVLESTVRRIAIPPAEVLAWLGPAIGADHFEVGAEVRTAFIRDDVGAAAAFVPNARGRWQCDLLALARRRLVALGVQHIYGGGWCTYTDPARFFSFRRDGRCGRMAAFIWADRQQP